jgi:hypothetical protein
MFSTLRRRIGAPGVIAVIALVFAMAGSAFAASNSGLTSKMKKEVEKIAKKYAGKNGAPGKDGAPGPQGAVGPQGSPGTPGSPGKDGATGGTGGTGKTGATGVTGSTGATGKTGEINTEGPLPVGQTETGVFAADHTITTGPSPPFATPVLLPISFPIPLANELTFTFPNGAPGDTVVVVKEGATTPGVGNCPGTPAEPEAASGFLCVYVGEEPTTLFDAVVRISGPGQPGTNTIGARLWFQVPENQNKDLYGSWAVTG